MRTIGAKVADPFYEKCEIVRRQEGLSRSDYVRRALEAYNILHYVRWLTDEGLPVKIMREPNAEERTESSPVHDTSIPDRIMGCEAEQVAFIDLRHG